MKRINKKGALAISQILILLIGIFAFGFILGGAELVSADDPVEDSACKIAGGTCSSACGETKEDGGLAGCSNPTPKCCVPKPTTPPVEEETDIADKATPVVAAVVAQGGVEGVKTIVTPEAAEKVAEETAKAVVKPVVDATAKEVVKEVITTITPKIAATLTPEIAATLTPEAIATLTPEIAATLSPEVVAALSEDAVAALSEDAVAALSEEALAAYTEATATTFWSTVGSVVTVAAHIVGAAAAAYGLGSLVNSLVDRKFNSEWTQVTTGVAAGAGAVGYLLIFTKVGSTGLIGLSGALTLGIIGVGIAAGVMFATPATEEAGVVNYYCNQWQPVTGGEECEACNNQEIPCSEYQCKSLGQACNFATDEETGETACFWEDRLDTFPPAIQPDESLLSPGYIYAPNSRISLPDRQVEIISDEAGEKCISPYEFLTFGVYTLNQNDEPERTQCKWDLERKSSFEEMSKYFGGSSFSKYNHKQLIKIPEVTPEGENEVSLYVKCQDVNGNYNPYNFIFDFCIKQGLDTTPPKIIETNPLNGSSISDGITSIDEMTIFVNKPSDCKWSHNDQRYEDMENAMQCEFDLNDATVTGLYPCNTNLTGLVQGEENKFYFSCKSNPQEEEEGRRFTMRENYEYFLYGSKPLSIINAAPNATTIKDSTDSVKVTLEVETFGGNFEGSAICYYSPRGTNSYSTFENSYSHLHSHDLWFDSGIYGYDIRCIDTAGNSDEVSLNFIVDLDKTEPIISRAYYEEGNMKIITNEASECVYSTTSCTYEFEDGLYASTSQDQLTHSIEWNTDSDLYVKCQDIYGNQPALLTECSMILRAHDY